VIVLVKDSETIVIAGLIKTNNVDITQKVPFLGDIPFLGEAFKSRSKSAQDTEILIFVTPHIIQRRPGLEQAKVAEGKDVGKRQKKITETLKKYKKP
jgi:type II secretory pathway component GspD/PulD (secretin)